MSRIGSNIARSTTLMQSNVLLSQLRRTQLDLFKAQNQLSTGNAINAASDEPSKISTVLYLRDRLAAREQHYNNLAHAKNVLNTADQALGEANTILMEARSIASSQIGIGSDATTRSLEAEVVASQLHGLLDLANQQYNDLSVFGGNNGSAADGLVFEEFMGGIRYTGSDENLKHIVGSLGAESLNTNGVEAFGALSNRVKSLVDLNPLGSADTRLTDITGALGNGVRKGSIQVSVGGATQVVDLSTADTLGDIATRINDALGANGTLTLNGDHFELTSAGPNITISDIGAGKTAQDAGISLSTAGPAVAGPDLGIKLTETTDLASLGAAIDWTGLSITQGETTKVADFTTAQTIEDLQNIIKDLDLGLRLEINDDQTGLDIISEVSGISLSVGENGGTTAEDLGLRTMGGSTDLADFRNGLGVETQTGEDDIRVTVSDGTSFTVDLTGAVTVQDVVDRVNVAAAGAGLAPADFSAGLASTGNGFYFEDNLGGAGVMTIENEGISLAATHLGIEKDAGAGTTITGDDVSQVRVDNFFTHLIDLENSLLGDDSHGITLAGEAIERDLESIVRARAIVGVQAKRVEDQQLRAEEMDLMETSMLSELEDADLTAVITEFQRLQTQLQASMQAGSISQQLSLLDFLR